MITTLAKAGVALTLSVGAICASVLPASAQDMELRIGPNGIRPVIRDMKIIATVTAAGMAAARVKPARLPWTKVSADRR